jgi:catechol 2,3-dioxygenase
MMTITKQVTTSYTIDPATTVGKVALSVANLDQMVRFYEQVMGLDLLEQSAESVELGVDNRPIVRLESRPNGRQYPKATGLYHLAILLPTRADLGQWLRHFVQSTSRMIDGASDHLVSEALYQRDPEGNGLEIYRDRPRDEWKYEEDGRIVMGGLALDLPALVADGHNEAFSKMPGGTTLGHVHLQVSDIPQTLWFYHELLGLENMISFDTAAFMAAGGYHHHLGANTWHSLGAAPPPENSLGLLYYTLILPDTAVRDTLLARLEAHGVPVSLHNGETLVRDPSGNAVVLTTSIR